MVIFMQIHPNPKKIQFFYKTKPMHPAEGDLPPAILVAGAFL